VRSCSFGSAGAAALGSELAKAFGRRPAAAIKPANLAKNDLREQFWLTVCVVREAVRKGSASYVVKQKFQKELRQRGY
jgi:hypothetical protein